MEWNEWGLRPHLCTYRLNWARGTSWGWWDDAAIHTHNSTFEPLRSGAELAISRSRRFPIILSAYEWAGKKHFVSLKLECRYLWLSEQAALPLHQSPRQGAYPANRRHWINTGVMLSHHRRRWTNIKTALEQKWNKMQLDTVKNRNTNKFNKMKATVWKGIPKLSMQDRIVQYQHSLIVFYWKEVECTSVLSNKNNTIVQVLK